MNASHRESHRGLISWTLVALGSVFTESASFVAEPTVVAAPIPKFILRQIPNRCRSFYRQSDGLQAGERM